MFTLNCKGRLLSLEVPVVMGIINTTPDSFYAASRQASTTAVLQQAEAMLKAGAALLDLGGQSTRPGLLQSGAEAEAARVLPAVEAVQQRFPEAFVSIDTYHASVAREAVAAGACLVNDISGGMLDTNMLTTVGQLQVPYVCTHLKGRPETMQQLAVYEDVAQEVLDFFIRQTERCRLAGIHDVIIDPGFGFAKNRHHNFRLLQQLPLLKILDKPLLAGLSRKSTIYQTLGITPEEALNGTTVLQTIALLNGASILRAHDVKEAREAIVLVEAYRNSQAPA